MISILTIGRTGSTLLMYMLNQIDDVTISGEIYNIDVFNAIDDNKVSDWDRFFNDRVVKYKRPSPTDPSFLPPNPQPSITLSFFLLLL